MRIIHFSDWHAKAPLPQLPPADLYVCTGDMLPDLSPKRPRKVIEQTAWRDANPFPRLDAPLIVVRGNHDFVALAPWFRLTDTVFEITDDPERTFTHQGVKFGGCRGIQEMGGNYWADELRDAEFRWRADHLPTDLDVLVTHAPCKGILDDGWGAGALSSYVNSRVGRGDALRFHLFGHIHEHGGQEVRYSSVTFSNAATTIRELEI